jgi:hypothetical protein
MKKQDVFEIAIRVLGLVLLYDGINGVPAAVFASCDAIQSMHVARLFMSLSVAAWPLLAGYYMLRGAPLIMRIACADAPVITKDGA